MLLHHGTVTCIRFRSARALPMKSPSGRISRSPAAACDIRPSITSPSQLLPWTTFPPSPFPIQRWSIFRKSSSTTKSLSLNRTGESSPRVEQNLPPPSEAFIFFPFLPLPSSSCLSSLHLIIPEASIVEALSRDRDVFRCFFFFPSLSQVDRALNDKCGLCLALVTLGPGLLTSPLLFDLLTLSTSSDRHFVHQHRALPSCFTGQRTPPGACILPQQQLRIRPPQSSHNQPQALYCHLRQSNGHPPIPIPTDRINQIHDGLAGPVERSVA